MSDQCIQVVSHELFSSNDEKLPDEPNTHDSVRWFALRNDEEP
jgi:hypothetical protein